MPVVSMMENWVQNLSTKRESINLNDTPWASKPRAEDKPLVDVSYYLSILLIRHFDCIVK